MDDTTDHETQLVINLLSNIAVETFATIHDLDPEISEALTDTVGRALVRFVEKCRKGSAVAIPGQEAYIDNIVTAVADRLYAVAVEEKDYRPVPPASERN